jgi:hypothetical protein
MVAQASPKRLARVRLFHLLPERRNTMVEEKGNIKVIRNFMIKTMKHYLEDVEFLKAVVEQNSKAFDAKDDMLVQLNKIKDDCQALIDYNFYPIEINAVEGTYKVDESHFVVGVADE